MEIMTEDKTDQILNNLNSENYGVVKLIKDYSERLNSHGIKLILTIGENESNKTGICNGDFNPISKTLIVNCNKSIDNWLPVLLLEFSHFEIWFTFKEEWELYNEMGNEINNWLLNKNQLSKHRLGRMINICRDFELKTEKISVEIIQKYNLPINITEYIQKANCFLYQYTEMKKGKKWNTTDIPPYDIKEIWESAPTKFLVYYERPPKKFKRMWDKYIKY